MHEDGSSHSLADYNRAGVPLLEIVSEPDMTTGAAAAAYGAEIRRIVRFLGVSNGNMQVTTHLPRPIDDHPSSSPSSYWSPPMSLVLLVTTHPSRPIGDHPCPSSYW